MHKDRIKTMEKKHKKLNAFTLAEVLITIVIIGVIAALTIPTVLKNYNDKKYNTARLKALKTFGEAGKMASVNDEMNSQENATDFVNNVLSKYLKITKVCDNRHPTDCGFPATFKASKSISTLVSNNLAEWTRIGLNTTQASSPVSDPKMSTFILTADGFSALVHYNPKCARNSHEITWTNCREKECWSVAIDQACMNVIYDMNGEKGPNHVGDDIGFVTTFWSGLKAISVAPGIIPYNINESVYNEGKKSLANAQELCASKGTNKIQYTLGSVEELQSAAINYYLTFLTTDGYWSGSSVADVQNNSWYVSWYGARYHARQSMPYYVWCVRR